MNPFLQLTLPEQSYSYAYLTHLLSNNGNDPGKNPLHVICETEVHTYFSSFQLKLKAPGMNTLETIMYEIPTNKNLDSALHELTDMVKGFIFTNVSHSK